MKWGIVAIAIGIINLALWLLSRAAYRRLAQSLMHEGA